MMKYATYLNTIENCPSTKCSPKSGVAYRFVYEDLHHPHNLLPAALIRQRPYGTPEQRCSAYALSMFRSESEARSRFAQLEKHTRNLREKIGSHLASVVLCPNDGVASSIASNGHFDFFESAGVDLVPRLTLVGAL